MSLRVPLINSSVNPLNNSFGYFTRNSLAISSKISWVIFQGIFQTFFFINFFPDFLGSSIENFIDISFANFEVSSIAIVYRITSGIFRLRFPRIPLGKSHNNRNFFSNIQRLFYNSFGNAFKISLVIPLVLLFKISSARNYICLVCLFLSKS